MDRKLLLISSLFLTAFWGCKTPSAPTPAPPVTIQLPPKPSPGSTYSFQGTFDSGSTVHHTNYTYTVIDTSTYHDGKAGVVEMNGNNGDFWMDYASNGDVYVWGSPDGTLGREQWVWFPFSLAAGHTDETYSEDTLISDPNLKDTRLIVKDSFTVIGNAISSVGDSIIPCIEGVWFENVTHIKGHNMTTVNDSAWYLYAPSIHYWLKEQTSSDVQQVTLQLTAYNIK